MTHRLSPALYSMALCLLGGAPPALAGQVAWVNWTSSDSSSVFGVATVDDTEVQVTYTGERQFIQLTCGTNYWVARSTTNPYTSDVVDNPPDWTGDNAQQCDIIALSQATSKGLTFSQPVTNPIFAVVSLNGNGYRFDRDFEILSYAQGYWGNGTLTKQITVHDDGSTTYDLIGSGEPHGTLQFIGTFQTVNWTSLTSENWNGFSIAIENLAVNVPPEIEVYGEGDVELFDEQSEAVDFGVVLEGESAERTFTIANSGTGPLNIDSLTLTGADAASFAIGSVVPAVAAGAQTTFTITLNATRGGDYSATLTITSDDADEGEFSFPIIGSTPLPTEPPTPTREPTATPDTPTVAPTPTATRAPTPTATRAPTPTATATPAPTPTATQASTPTATQAPTPTSTQAPTPTSTRAPTPSATATRAPTPLATATPSPTATATLESTASLDPTETVFNTTPTAAATASDAPSATPEVTATATASPTARPTAPQGTPMEATPTASGGPGCGCSIASGAQKSRSMLGMLLMLGGGLVVRRRRF